MNMIYKSVSQFLTSSEALIGDLHFINNNLIIPFQNLYIMETCEQTELKNNICKYINYSFVLFRNVESITWSYEQSRKLINYRECFGGEVFRDGFFHEFWISHERGDLILTNESSFSSKMFPREELMLNKFFNNINYNEFLKSSSL